MSVQKYKDMIKAYLDHTLSTEDFETTYLSSFKSEPGGMDPRLFDILEDLFEDLDAYSPLFVSEDETPFLISDSTLRKEAVEALARIEEYLSSL